MCIGYSLIYIDTRLLNIDEVDCFMYISHLYDSAHACVFPVMSAAALPVVRKDVRQSGARQGLFAFICHKNHVLYFPV